MDMIFATQEIQEKAHEQNKDLYMTFVDLTKAFDRVNHKGLWKFLHKFACPEKMIAVILIFHDFITARLMKCGDTSEAFLVTNSNKQGCLLVSALSLSLQSDPCSQCSTLIGAYTFGLDWTGVYSIYSNSEFTYR